MIDDTLLFDKELLRELPKGTPEILGMRRLSAKQTGCIRKFFDGKSNSPDRHLAEAIKSFEDVAFNLRRYENVEMKKFLELYEKKVASLPRPLNSPSSKSSLGNEDEMKVDSDSDDDEEEEEYESIDDFFSDGRVSELEAFNTKDLIGRDYVECSTVAELNSDELCGLIQSLPTLSDSFAPADFREYPVDIAPLDKPIFEALNRFYVSMLTDKPPLAKFKTALKTTLGQLNGSMALQDSLRTLVHRCGTAVDLVSLLNKLLANFVQVFSRQRGTFRR